MPIGFLRLRKGDVILMKKYCNVDISGANKITVYSSLGFHSDMSPSPKVSVGKNI